MRRVAVLGCGGAGKTTLARAVAARLDLPVIHGDLHRPEWERVQPALIAQEKWVIDAMRLGSLDDRLSAADTAIFIDRSVFACLLGVLRRRHRYGGGVHAAVGVADFVNWEFVRWIVSFRRRQRPKILALLAQHAAATRIVILRNRREIDAFVRSLA